jgi:hypothetical protein
VGWFRVYDSRNIAAPSRGCGADWRHRVPGGNPEAKAGFVRKGKNDVLILIIVLLLIFGGGGGYYGHSRWGPGGGAGVSVGTILLILLVAYLLGIFH